jgi:hypothetical protein
MYATLSQIAEMTVTKMDAVSKILTISAVSATRLVFLITGHVTERMIVLMEVTNSTVRTMAVSVTSLICLVDCLINIEKKLKNKMDYEIEYNDCNKTEDTLVVVY